MAQFFTHNPLAWDFGDKTMGKHNQIIEERRTNGYAFYDWINFNDYLTSLNHRVVQEISTGLISVDDETQVKARELNDHGDDLKNDALSIDEIESLDLALEKERKFVHDTVQWNRVFYSEIFPKLPFIVDYTPYAVVEGDRKLFIHPRDHAAIGSFVQYVLIDGLQKFIDQGSGYPAGLPDFDAWAQKLESYIKLFGNVQNWSHSFNREVFDDFMNHFPTLWD